MVLLTSSQVSVLLSSAIGNTRPFPHSSPVPRNGYVIQQRTLSQLREAIKPDRDPRPSPKTSYVVPEHLKNVPGNGQNVPLYGGGKQDQIVIEVNPSVPEHQQQPKKLAGQKKAGWTSDMWKKMMPSEREEPGVSKDDLEKMDERERNIEGWKVKDQKHPDPDAASEKPISRAERRRLIKEEIKRLSQGEQPVYYQRRLW
ncbi:hypothetical protein CkaCkLH20_03025 [Colletotrichum karsti]|uniref:Uncharacterized protein n=1 Tax=Colletotrichum karsti TaxID=1095194 RepID=A0A9P6LPC5_9PEZI|nr:uncharacterized protein CkaCkLH20_03025 [Colletotrichum karsti]KAF9879482.1 hypothetical protein CkaCkLH20_03025 [Colletotrichum karsti]